jgi:fibronectin-binding autotransporter adhesin
MIRASFFPLFLLTNGLLFIGAGESSAQKLLDPSGPISSVTASSGGNNTSVAVAYSIRQLKTTYDHTAITPPASVVGFTNSTTPLIRVKRSFDNAQLDIGYDGNGNIDTLALKYFVTGKIGLAGPTNPTADGTVTIWYDQSGNSRDASVGSAIPCPGQAVAPYIVTAGVIERNGGGQIGITGKNGGMLGEGGTTYDLAASGFNRYGIVNDRTLNVVSQPRSYANGNANDGAGTYLVDRNGGTGIQDPPLTCIKAVGNNWALQIRNESGDISKSFGGSVPISTGRSDNVTVTRSGDLYSMYVNGILAGSNTLTGNNSMSPVRIGYGCPYGENVFYGEFILFPQTLSNTDLTNLNNSQNVYFSLGPTPGTWTGAVSSDFNTAGNWSNNAVPTNISAITISSGAINPLIITTGQNLTVKKMTLNTGATLTINATGTLTFLDDAVISGTVSGTGALIAGGSLVQTISGTGSISINNLTITNTADTVKVTTDLNIAGTLTINAGAVFSPSAAVVINTAANAGTITGSGTAVVTRTAATADFQSQYKFTTNTLSNLTICYGGSGDQTINLGVNYGNLSVGGSGTKTLSTAINSTNVTGSITVLSGTLATNNHNITSPTNRTITIAQDALFDAGTSTITFGSGTKTITINGTFKTANLTGLSGGAGTSITNTNTPVVALGALSTIEYYAAAAQTVTPRTDYYHLVLTGGSKTISGTNTLGGSLTINTGATYSGASNPTLNIGGNFSNSGTFTSGTGTVTFNGTSNQTITSGSTIVFGGSVAFSGSATATMGVNATVSGNLNVNSGKTLDLGLFTLNRNTAGGTLTVAGTLQLGANTGGKTGSNFPDNFSTFTPTSGTIEYNGNNAITQTIFATTYNNLTLTNGSGTGTALKVGTASFAVNTGNFTVNAGAKFTPAAANIISGTGTLTGFGIVDVTGANLAAQYTLTRVITNLTINYAGGSSTIPAGTYTSLSVSGTGTKTLGGAVVVTGDLVIDPSNVLDVSASNFPLTVGGNFTNNGTFTQQSGTVTLNGGGAQTIGGSATTTFNNLTISKTTDTTFITTDINISGTFSIGSSVNTVVYPSDVVVINSAAAGTLSGSGGTICVTRTAATADLRNQYKFNTYTFTSITVNYAGYGDQTINVSGTPTIAYSNLAVSGSGNKSLNAAITTTNLTGNILVNAAKMSTANQAIRFNNSRSITINSGAVFDAGTSVLRHGTGSTLTNNGTYITSNSNGFWVSGSTVTSVRGTVTFAFGANSTIEYNSASAQTISQGVTYKNIILTGGSKTITAGTNTIQESLTINSGATYNGASNPTLNIGGDFTNTGTFTSGTGTVTFNGTSNQTITSGTTIAFGGSVVFSGSATATMGVNATVAGNLNVNSGKTLDLGTFSMNRTAAGGTLTVAGTLQLGANTGGKTGSNFPNNFNTFTATNGTIEYNGSNAITQTVFATTYYNLTLTNGSGTGTATKISTGNIVVNTGDFSIGLNTLFQPASGNIISGTGTLTGYGTFEVTGTTLAAQYTITNKTLTNLTINYTGNTQTIAAGTYTSISATGGGTKTFGGAIVCTGDVNIASGSTLDVSASNYALSVGGDWVNDGTFNQRSGTVTFNGTTTQTISGATTTSFSSLTITNTTGSIVVSSNINISGTLNMNGAGTLLDPAATTVLNSGGAAGTLTGTGAINVTRIASTADLRNQYKFNTYTLTSITVNYTGAGNQIINLSGSPTLNYSSITVSGSGTKTLDAAVSGTNITGDITVSAGTLATGNFNISSPTNRNISVASGAILDAGTSTIAFGSGTKVFTLNGTLKTANPNGFSGGASTTITNANSPTIIIGNASTLEYTGTGAQTITQGTFNNLMISNTSSTQTVNGNLVVNGLLLTAAGGTLNLGTNTLSGSLSVLTNNGTIRTQNTSATPIPGGLTIGGTVTYDAGGAQTIVVNTYNDLSLAGSGNKSLNGNTTVNNITVGGTSVLLGGSFALTVLGNWINNSTLTANTGSVSFNGLSAQTMSGTVVPVFNNLTINNSSGVIMNAAVTVSGALNVSSGKLSIGSNTLTINGTISTTANNSLSSNGTSNLVIGSTGGNGTLFFDQTTPGTTNKFGSLVMNRSGNTIALGNNLELTTALTLTAGKLAIGSNTLTLSGSVSTSATNSIVANGSSNLIINGTGALGSSLFLDQSAPGTSNRVNNFTFNRSAATISLGDTLEVVGTVTPTLGTLATGNKLRLVSNASGTARVASGSGSYITGNVLAERFIPSIARRWRFYGSPVSGATFADLKNEIYITGQGGATNGFDPTLSNYPSVYGYDETKITGNADTGYVAITNITDPIVVGKGYRVFIRGDRSDAGRLDGTNTTQNAVTMDIRGPLNMGNITLPVTFSSSGTAANDGWNLVSNPYASPIDWNAFHDAGRTGSDPDYSGTDYAHVKPTVYIYDAATSSYTSFNAVSNSGVGSLSNGIIPSGGAFWVQAVAAAPSITMKEIYKTASAPAAVFKTAPGQFSIKLIKDSITRDEAGFKYIAEATPGYDAYDIRKLNGSIVDIASIGNDGSFLSMNCKPFNGHSDTILLSMGFASSGEYTLTFGDVDAMGIGPQFNVYLVDKFTQQVNDVRNTAAYTFMVDKNDARSFGNDRFKLIVGEITTAIPVVEKQTDVSKYYLYPSTTSDWITVYSESFANGKADIEIIDITGKTVERYAQLEWNQHKLRLDVSNFQSGVYLLKVTSGGRLQPTLRWVKE